MGLCVLYLDPGFIVVWHIHQFVGARIHIFILRPNFVASDLLNCHVTTLT